MYWLETVKYKSKQVGHIVITFYADFIQNQFHLIIYNPNLKFTYFVLFLVDRRYHTHKEPIFFHSEYS